MDLPETNILNFFNKVLISLLELTPAGGSCSIDSLINQCKYTGLVKIVNKNITISSLGQKFLNANRERYFEINEAQKQLITERIIFLGVWSHYARELFNSFSLNQVTETYELSIVDISLSKNQNASIHFFKYLGILQE